MSNDTTRDLDPWSLIGKGLLKYIKWGARDWRFGGHYFLPVPYVDRLLRELHREHRNNFCLMTLRWSAPANEKSTVRAFALPLPLIAPKPDHLGSTVARLPSPDNTAKPKTLEELCTNGGWWTPELVVARCAAAAWVNLRMLLGPGELEVDFLQAESGDRIESAHLKGWIEAIKWVQEKDHHDTLWAYLLQVGCPRYLNLADQPVRSGIPHTAGDSPPYLLGIDIGGTSIKWCLYTGKDQPTVTEVRSGKLFTERGTKYRDGADFCTYVCGHIRMNLEKLDINLEGLCVGVTWPGPVRGEPGREYVAGTSGILAKFEKLSSTIKDNSPDGIHSLKIREGFVSQFGDYVRLINDGDGHVNAARAQAGKLRGSWKGKRLMVVVAGTGTALGLVEDDRITPFLNEIGKMIINLVEPFLDYQKGGNFPAGVANQLFSEKTNPRIAEDLFNSSVSNREVSWLYELYKSNEKQFNTDDWMNEVFDTLPAHLTWMKDNRLKELIRQVREEQLGEYLSRMKELLERASWLTADLIAMCADILKADAVYLSGGPVTVIGETLQQNAQEHLKKFYGFETENPDGSHAIKGLSFLRCEAGETSAAMGAACAARETFFSASSSRDGDNSIREIDPVFLA